MSNISQWMSWSGGVDLVASTHPNMNQPNVIIHVARQVQTPIGTAASGMILWMPDPDAGPIVMGFVSEDTAVGQYFGPNIFNGTPFEHAPVVKAEIDISLYDQTLNSRTTVLGHVFEVELSDFGPMELIHRPIGSPMPFVQSGSERVANAVRLTVDGIHVPIFVPSVGISGGYGAVDSRFGFYAR